MGHPLVRGADASGGQVVQLRVSFLNGNRLQTLPHELGKLTTPESLDVNELRYNINNWEFNWNWCVCLGVSQSGRLTELLIQELQSELEVSQFIG